MVPEQYGQTAAVAARSIARPEPFLTGIAAWASSAEADLADRPGAAVKDDTGLTLDKSHLHAPALN
jgi:hypothetical protein